MDQMKSIKLNNELTKVINNNIDASTYFDDNNYYFIESFQYNIIEELSLLLKNFKLSNLDQLQYLFNVLTDITELINNNYIIVNRVYDTFEYIALSENECIKLINYLKTL